MEPGLEETTFYDPENFVFPFGAHACVVEVDAETGKVDVVRYVAVDDCGPAINPMLIDGQVHGGIVHAHRPGALRAGRLRRGRPARHRHVRRLRAAERRRGAELRDRPHRDAVAGQLARRQGRRRGGHDRRSPAVVNAVIDALQPLGVTYIDMPLTPDAGVAGDPGGPGQGEGPARTEQGKEGGSVMIPAEFDYVAPASLDEAIGRAARGRRGREAAGRRALAAPADEAAAGGARRCSSTCAACPGCAGVQRENGDRAHRRDDPSPRGRPTGEPRARLAPAASTIADQQVRNRGTIGGSLAHGDPASDLPAVLLAMEGVGHRARARRRSARSPRPTSSRTT